MIVRHQEIRRGIDRTNHFKLSVKCSLGLGLFDGLVDALVNKVLHLVVDAVDSVVLDILEGAHSEESELASRRETVLEIVSLGT
jgi:hypothetical protein